MTRVRVMQRDGVAVLDFGPGPHSIDEKTLTSIRKELLDAANVESRLLVMDLSQVEFFGSSFIEVMFQIWSRMNARKGKFVICGLSEYCAEVIEVTNLNSLWTIYGDVDSAIAGARVQ